MRIRLLVLAVLLTLVPAHPRALTSTRVTVSTSATLLFTGPSLPSGVCPANPACKVLVRNPSAVSVYVGPAAVTTATGFEIAAGDAMSISMYSGDQLYGIVVAATQVVHTIVSNP